MNTNPNARSLIFRNLPFEIECIILNFYREIRNNAWHETLRMFSTKKLAREIYRQSEMQDHFVESFGHCNPCAYKREMFRLYSMYLPEYSSSLDEGIVKEDLCRADGHAMVNMSILLNDAVDQRIISISFVTPHDIIQSLDDYIPFKCDAIQDIYDEELVTLWKGMCISKKETLIKKYFQSIKDDCLRNYGMVNSENMLINMRESAYRVLRFGVINDPEQFKMNSSYL